VEISPGLRDNKNLCSQRSRSLVFFINPTGGQRLPNSGVRTKQLTATVGMYLLLLGIAFAMLFPLLWLLGTSLKSPTEDIFTFPPQLIPARPTLANFFKVLEVVPFQQYFVNSVFIAFLTVTINVIFCSLAAYPLARLDFRGRDLIFAVIVATITIPFQIVMIPLYILTVNLHLTDTYLGVIFPSLASAFGIFLMRQAFQGVPKELEEAARIDGCSELGIWWHIMLPAVRPAVITLGLFVFIGSWSDFLWPLIVLKSPERFTLPIGVANLAGTFDTDWRSIAAGSILAIFPILIVFVFLQRYIIATDVGSGVKG
jgi:putative chitobiose transport system permease protein